MAMHKVYYEREGGGFPKFGRGESCESMFAYGLSMHQKCYKYALTNFLFGLCE